MESAWATDVFSDYATTSEVVWLQVLFAFRLSCDFLVSEEVSLGLQFVSITGYVKTGRRNMMHLKLHTFIVTDWMIRGQVKLLSWGFSLVVLFEAFSLVVLIKLQERAIYADIRHSDGVAGQGHQGLDRRPGVLDTRGQRNWRTRHDHFHLCAWKSKDVVSWRISSGGSLPSFEESRKHSVTCRWCGMSYEWQEPNWLLTLCEQNTLTRLIFSYLHACKSVARDIGSRCCPRHVIHVSCACVSDFSSTLHFALFTVSLIFYFIFHVGRFGENSPVRFREWGVWLFGQQRPSHILQDQIVFPAYAADGNCDNPPGLRTDEHHQLDDRQHVGKCCEKFGRIYLEEGLRSSKEFKVAGCVRVLVNHWISRSRCRVDIPVPVTAEMERRPVDEFGSLISNVRENPCRDSENEQIRILLERKKEQILANCRAEI